MQTSHLRLKTCLRVAVVLFVLAGAGSSLLASQHAGRVTFGGLPVPGATVTATQGDKQVVTATDQQGIYRLADLADGTWTVRVEMLGFAKLTKEIAVAADAPPAMWELTLLPFEEIARDAVQPKPETTSATATSAAVSGNAASKPTTPAQKAPSAGFQQAAVNAATPASIPDPANAGNLPNAANPANASPSDQTNADLSQRAADGLLVNGSVNNGAASPFAQLAAFGNNRRGVRSLYNGALGVLFGNSAWDARSPSFTGQQTSKPSYDDTQMLGTFGGPVKISNLQNRANLFVGYQRTSNHSATTQPARMPTQLERSGDFSQTANALGQPVTIVDPQTGLPFSGNVIPPGRISSQAAALLAYYPQPNVDAAGRFNFQEPTLVATRQDSVQSRLTQSVSGRTQVFGNLGYQRTTTDTTSVFGFSDSSRVSNFDTAANWSRRFSPFFSLRLRYQFTRQTTETTPLFANRTNVSGDAGITGNNQDPANWGPPTLTFSSGLAGLTDAQYVSNHSETHAVSAESGWSRGRHYLVFGGGVRRNYLDVLSQQDPRGTFGFTGAATGSDLADFLLGLPQTSSIAFGNPDKYLRANVYEAYLNDDWRVSPGFTFNLGLRWEYEAPMAETLGRLVNLDVAPGFAAVSPVVASNPVGALTNRRYPDSLLNPDRRGIQPRVGLAWRPVAGSSLVVRAGYGIYRNTNVYQSIAMLMAQQPPLSNTLSVANPSFNPPTLTLANGFIAGPGVTPNTFAVDPDFRVGYAQNWQVSMQRDLPASLTMIATYFGAKGSHLMQEFLPNTYPAGAVNPCPACPAGFVYLTSNGSSSRQSVQLELRRRLRNGFTASTQYTLSKSTDDAGAFTGVSLTGAAIAQDWLNLDAERGPSNFDQRHLVTAQVQYTTGIGVAGGGLLTGVKGALVKGWTVTSQLTAGSGLPLNPVFLNAVAGTGVNGTLRPSLTGAPTDGPAGLYANPSAYTAPAAGSWGNAGRNSLRGPAQFSLNMGLGRSFPWGDRLSLDWRVDATNVLNRVTYSGVDTIVGSPQFGLPNSANTMRKIQTSLRMRF